VNSPEALAKPVAPNLRPFRRCHPPGIVDELSVFERLYDEVMGGNA
jgi:hypothetical protein